jgi:DNA adenine methylase
MAPRQLSTLVPRTPIKQHLAGASQREASASLGHPFLKWAGGKRQLLPALSRHIPDTFGTYFEPFLGGGALFFHLAPAKAVLGDSNERLIRACRALKGNVEMVIKLLQRYPHSKVFFHQLRAERIDRKTDEEVGAWLIYLNKTGFNGLYRVNRQNVFNVPFGNYANPNICDVHTLRSSAQTLRRATLIAADFESTTRTAREGDFVYFDPPYLPRSVSSSFTSYTAKGFGIRDHERLRDVALKLKRRGVRVLLSNSGTEIVEQLYRKDFTLEPVLSKRRINSDPSARGAVEEYLIT